MANKRKKLTELEDAFLNAELRQTGSEVTGKGRLKVSFTDAMGREGSIVVSQNSGDPRAIKNAVRDAKRFLKNQNNQDQKGNLGFNA